jgi:NitT/TauT family transport system substrate-binding protein
MGKVRPGLKGLIILLIVAIVGIGIYKLMNSDLGKKIIPESKKTEATKMTDDAKAAVKSGAKVIKVGINTWGGYAPGPYYNKSFGANTQGRYYTQDGILVDFVVIDDFKAMRDAWKSGSIDVLGLATADSLPTEIADLMQYKPKVIVQVDYSRGGDAVVVVAGIKSAKDLIGKKVAVALGTPSHSLLLSWLNAGGVDYKQVQIVGTDSGIAAAQQFKAGAVHAAVVWSPDDQECVKAISGSYVLFNTKKATHVIADVFLVKDEYLRENHDVVQKFVKGWLTAAGEINSDAGVKNEAANVISRGFNVDIDMATLMINNARLSTYGDNLVFFGLRSGGVRGEEIYDKMSRMFAVVGLAPNSVPAWRIIVDTSLVSSLNLTCPGSEAEGAAKFAAPTTADSTAPAFADKAATVQFAFGSAKLSEEGKMAIDMAVANTSKEFGGTRIRIEGNTDSVGKHDTNVKLSNARAKSVATYLVQKFHFDPNRFVIVGHGPDNPVQGCEADTSDGCMARNRRTEFYLLK